MATDIEGIKARTNAATPGPWKWNEDECEYESLTKRVYVSDHGDFELAFSNSDADHRFVENAASDIRDLLAEVESLRAAAHEVVTLADAAGPDTFWTRWNDLAEAVDKLREVVGL